MTLGKKIRTMIRESKYKTLNAFHNALTDFHGEVAISRRTLTRIVNDQVAVKNNALGQIALLFDVPISTLLEGTDAKRQEVKNELSSFPYNSKAVLYCLRKDLPFIPQKLCIKAGGRTSLEQDRTDASESLKWVFVIKGQLSVVFPSQTREETKTLRVNQEISFDARQTHYFLNNSGWPVTALVMHYPSRNSDFYLTE